MAHSDELDFVQPGDVTSAKWANAVVELLKRKFFGPGIQVTPEGFYIPGSGVTEDSGIGMAVMRELDLTDDAEFCKMQEVAYNNDSKLTGESDFYKHVVAIGGLFNVYPPPTATWEMFVAEGALRLVEEADDPENLSSAVLWWFTRDNNWAWMWLKTSENMTAEYAGE